MVRLAPDPMLAVSALIDVFKAESVAACTRSVSAKTVALDVTTLPEMARSVTSPPLPPVTFPAIDRLPSTSIVMSPLGAARISSSAVIFRSPTSSIVTEPLMAVAEMRLTFVLTKTFPKLTEALR